MAVSASISVEEYLRTGDWEPDAEYVDGEIEERPMGERNHASWQKALLLWFSKHEDAWNVRVYAELRVQTSATRFRVPDIAVLDAGAPDQQIPTHPPLAVFEVLSPEDRIQRMMRKLGDYERMGIPAIWVIDPESGRCSRFEDGQLLRSDQFSLPMRELAFPLAEVAKLVR